MPSANTVVVRMNTPVDPETGQRKQMIIETTLDHVYDPETGSTLAQILEDRNYGNADESNNGLMTANHVKDINSLMESRSVISEDNPGESCMWFQIVSEETSAVTPPSDVS